MEKVDERPVGGERPRPTEQEKRHACSHQGKAAQRNRRRCRAQAERARQHASQACEAERASTGGERYGPSRPAPAGEQARRERGDYPGGKERHAGLGGNPLAQGDGQAVRHTAEDFQHGHEPGEPKEARVEARPNLAGHVLYSLCDAHALVPRFCRHDSPISAKESFLQVRSAIPNLW